MKKNYDVRIVLLVGAALSLLAVVFRRAEWLAGLFVLALACRYAYCGSVGLGLGRNGKRLLITVMSLVFIQSLFLGDSGAPWVSIGGISLISMTGLLAALAVMCRMLVLFISASMVVTVGTGRLLDVIASSDVPHEIAFMLGMGIRFFPVMREEIMDSWQAIQMRGIDFRKVPWHKKLKVITLLFMPLLSNTLLRIRRITYAMELRGYAPGVVRTKKAAQVMSARHRSEAVFILFIAVILIVLYFMMGAGGLV